MSKETKEMYGVKLVEYEYPWEGLFSSTPGRTVEDTASTFHWEVANLERRGTKARVRRYKNRCAGSPRLKGDLMNATKMMKRYQAYWERTGKFFEDA